MIFDFLQKMRNHWLTLLQVHLIFVLLGVAILGPLFGILLQFAVELSGNPAVADQDIARLLLTPLGMTFTVLLISVLLAISAMEMGALLAVAMAAEHSLNCTPLQATWYSIRHGMSLLRLTLELTFQIVVRTTPFLVVVGITAWYFLTDYDINFYLQQRPPELWWAISIGLLSLALYAWFMGRQLLRWCLALPLVLFGDLPRGKALSESERLTAGEIPELVRVFVVCLAVAALIGVIPHLLFDIFGGWVVGSPYDRLAPLIFMLGSLIVAWLVINFFTIALGLASFAFVTLKFYCRLGPEIDKDGVQTEFNALPRLALDWGVGRITLVVLAVAGMAVFAGGRLLANVRLDDTALIIAHRGAAGAAPENTMAAVRRAIADGADWVEIDVQESRDGHVVVFHDSDFMKLSGNPLKIWDGDLADIQQQDIGSWFGPEFAGEQVPTLAQVLEETRGRAGLMIELKYYGHDQQLEQRVVDIVESAGMADEVSIMSLKLQGVQKLQALRPDWKVGLLAATAVGDLAKVDVDFLAVSARMATTRFIRRVHASGKRVLVWTVNDALSMSKWMSMGVDGVITDEPALAGEVLRERAAMSSAERLLVSAALFLGKPVEPGEYRDDSP
ncbi:MAG: glycerophosphodiester phosphodiesterase [Proteobacteria bacterium]|nr:glycerophosphodiester phosphodiesterase [Pseudomonadota bacterium]